MEKGKNLQDLLREAARVPGQPIPLPVPVEITREEGVAKALEVIIDDKRDEWEKIKEAMDGRFAKRFIDEMDGLSGKEFIRVYTKMLEYVRPKIIRVEGKQEEEKDDILRIEIYNAPQQKIIDITPEEDGSE